MALRVESPRATYARGSLAVLSAVAVDDFSPCAGAGECAPLHVTRSADLGGGCGLPANASLGRMALSADRGVVTFACFNGTTAGGALGPNDNLPAVVASLPPQGGVDASRTLSVLQLGAADSGMDADCALASVAAESDGGGLWLAGDKVAAPLGVLFLNSPAAGTPARLAARNALKVSAPPGGSLFVLVTRDVVAVLNASAARANGLPAAAFMSATITGAGLGWTDVDATSVSSAWIVGAAGLFVASRSAAGRWTVASVAGSPAGLLAVAVSADGSAVYAANATAVFAYSPGAGAWANGGAPVAWAPAGTEYRGLAGVPVTPPSATPTATSTSSITPSSSITGSTSATPSYLSSASPSPSATVTPSPTGTSTPSPTATGSALGGAVPPNTFVVAVIGNGTQPLWGGVSIMTRMSLEVYTEPAGGNGPVLERTVPLGYQQGAAVGSVALDRWGFRPITVNTRRDFTRAAARLVVSPDRTAVTVTGYDQAPEGMNLDAPMPSGFKREAAHAILRQNGSLLVNTFCKTANTGYAGNMAPFYW